MAAEGAKLTHHYTAAPVCAPARASLQTGLYATETTVHRNGVALPTDQKTLAHRFGEAGYRTGYIGKWHLGSQDPVPEDEQGGYEYWLGANLLEFVSEPYHTVLYDRQGEAHELPGYRPVSDDTVRATFDAHWGVTLHDEPGWRIPNMLDAAVDGSFKGIYIQGEDIAQSDPNTQHVEAALENMDCVVVQDLPDAGPVVVGRGWTQPGGRPHAGILLARRLPHGPVLAVGQRRVEQLGAHELQRMIVHQVVAAGSYAGDGLPGEARAAQAFGKLLEQLITGVMMRLSIPV